jgi:uncharacterized protein YciI
MPQWLVTAHDGDDPEAPARRQAARSEHLAFIGPMVERGEVLLGGAILDEAGTMIGSSVVVEFADRAALDAWLESDPYVKHGVWRRIDVKPFRVAVTAKPAA